MAIPLICGARNTTILNGGIQDHVARPDTGGLHVGAHHGGVIYAEGKYWWYGQAFQAASTREGGQTTDMGVVMYSSTDLYNWKNEGVVFGCQPFGVLEGPLRYERAKIVYNEKTQRYVMWFHYVGKPGKHGRKAGTADAGVASSASINGPYLWHGFRRPAGPDMTVKDCTLFKDDDGTAYFIFDSFPEDGSADRCVFIAELSDDYLGVMKVQKIPNTTYREAPAMIKRDGKYLMVTSGTHGWEPNEAKYHRAVWAPEKIIALPSGKMSGQAPGLIAAVAEERGLEPMLAAQQM